jgi:hypothetical protein
VLTTRSFSINLPSWLDPSRLWNDLKQWATNAGNWVASGVGGRTPPLSNCGQPAPGWFTYEKLGDMVHTCSIDNSGRGEIQIKSNRGITLEVHVPGRPEYVWVEDEADWMRRLYSLGSDANQLVLLAPGQRMTVGYARPGDAFTGEFTIVADSWRAFVDDAIRAAIDLVPGHVLAGRPGTLVAATWGKCGVELHASAAQQSIDEKTVGAFIGCMFCLTTPQRRFRLSSSLAATEVRLRARRPGEAVLGAGEADRPVAARPGDRGSRHRRLAPIAAEERQ